MIIGSQISNLPNTKEINNNIFVRNSNKHIIHDDKNYISDNNNNIFFDEERNKENQYKKIKLNNIIQKNGINEDDMKIFEKIIEQGIMEKNNIDKEKDIDNKIKKINSSYIKRKQKEKIKALSLNTSIMSYKIKYRDELKDKGIKNEISHFINNILEETEI
jgi:hypothetical protein